jgi:enoyl-CoA hydratase/carnithine racemase
MSDARAAGVRTDLDGPVCTITLSRPEALNAQTPATWRALREIGESLDPGVRVVVVRGEGRSFSAGLDRSVFAGASPDGAPTFAEMATMPPEECAALIASYQEAFTWLRRPEIVSVAAVQGHAIGAGFQLALACDLRVLADDAQLCMAETTLGIVPDLAGTKPLVEAVGRSRALEICLTGRRVPADEAERIGLATLVVARDALDDTVADLVSALVAPPVEAVRETKALIAGAAQRTHAEQEAAERAAQTRRLRTLASGG